jgi:uncharacterized membrane protein YqaE (UPF0057 family)
MVNASSALRDAGESNMSALIIFFGFAFLYMLPWLLAVACRNRNASGIFILNLFLGWTMLGWIGAMIWAVWVERKNESPNA